MDWTNMLVVFHVVLALAIICLVLLQHGRGADMGSGFGGGSSGSLFGASGSANFLSRSTAVLATIFFLSSLGLAYLATNKPRDSGGVMDRTPAKAQPQKPAGEAQKAAPEVQKAAPAQPPKPQGKDVPQ